MAAHYTHSRSAILCFGGWGLQTLLHTAPRIQAAQEQRAARGKEEPDLTRITSFGALLPEPLLTGSGLAQFRLSHLAIGQVSAAVLRRAAAGGNRAYAADRRRHHERGCADRRRAPGRRRSCARLSRYCGRLRFRASRSRRLPKGQASPSTVRRRRPARTCAGRAREDMFAGGCAARGCGIAAGGSRISLDPIRRTTCPRMIPLCRPRCTWWRRCSSRWPRRWCGRSWPG